VLIVLQQGVYIFVKERERTAVNKTKTPNARGLSTAIKSFS
jgi:hypothetical protein